MARWGGAQELPPGSEIFLSAQGWAAFCECEDYVYRGGGLQALAEMQARVLAASDLTVLSQEGILWESYVEQHDVTSLLLPNKVIWQEETGVYHVAVVSSSGERAYDVSLYAAGSVEDHLIWPCKHIIKAFQFLLPLVTTNVATHLVQFLWLPVPNELHVERGAQILLKDILVAILTGAVDNYAC